MGNYTGNNVVKIAAGGGSASVVSTGGLTLAEAAGVVVDGAGNLYIADYGHNRIVLVTSTGTASAVSITGLATAINQPAALALDGSGESLHRRLGQQPNRQSYAERRRLCYGHGELYPHLDRRYGCGR